VSIVDLHCDTISSIYQSGESLLRNSGHFDLERARRAGMDLQVFALFVSPAEGSNSLRQIMKQIDYFHQQLAANEALTYMVSSYDDIGLPGNAGKLGCLLHLEGSEAIGPDLEMLRLMYRLGLRSLGLTWNHRNLLADGVMEAEGGAGLSKQGKKTVQELNRLRIILDLAHAGRNSFNDALEVYEGPVMVSHANARRICDHPRNLDDDQLRSLAQRNGVIGVTMVRDFVGQESTDIEALLDHMVYIAELTGVEHLALGSDFDGADHLVMPGIEGYNEWESLLDRRGFAKDEREMIMKGNAIRLFQTIL